ncbi:hypothetical protein FISHEDRAFT_70380 [Fistulina hepatica ATCC 64428]|uniref:Uncharacterized protein n=1 Tax=Fistulina hepatica ATCC 64428 TaxID=1128425 RepID=A0A0D7AM77_9AGAR|nr:hypothetical protein FISHEDRAFT_70380 [Fistulina hepatica ATCC 64428]
MNIQIFANSDVAALPVVKPSLLPFRIRYSGPAPISTYFHVKPAPETVGAPPPPSIPEKKDAPKIASAMDATAVSNGVDAVAQDSSNTPTSSSHTNPATRLVSRATRFIASFRGRTVHGLEAKLPEGYTGVVLRVDDQRTARQSGRAIRKPASAAENGRGKARQTQQASRQMADEDDEDDIGHDDDMMLNDSQSARTLVPVATFPSMVVWHPDIPVDEGRDEYLRTLTEWTRIAHEIHRSE